MVIISNSTTTSSSSSTLNKEPIKHSFLSQLPPNIRRYTKIFLGAVVLGSAMEAFFVRAGFYDQLRLSESRKRLESEEYMEQAIDRLSQQDRFKYIQLPFCFICMYKRLTEVYVVEI